MKRTLDELDDIVDDIQFFESSLTDENSRLIMRLLMEAYNASDQRTEIIEKQENNPHIRQLLSGISMRPLSCFAAEWTNIIQKAKQINKPITLRVLYVAIYPHSACSHIFCLECLYGTLQRCEDREDFKINCPVCRIKFSSASYCPDMTVLNRTTDEFFTTDSMVQPRKRRVSSGNRAQGSDLSPNKRRKAKGGVMFLCQSFDRSQADRKATDGWIEHVGREMPSARFQNDTSVRVMIATEETGGVGICLTAGNKSIVIVG